jgi:hypothetical protein
MKTFFKLTAWTALVLALLGVLLGVLTAIGAHQGWFGSHDIQWVIGHESVDPSQLSAMQVTTLAAALGLAFGLVFLLLGLLLPLGVLLVGGAVALGLVVSLPFVGLGLLGAAMPYVVVALLVWWMWRLAHPKQAKTAPGTPASAAQPAQSDEPKA